MFIQISFVVIKSGILIIQTFLYGSGIDLIMYFGFRNAIILIVSLVYGKEWVTWFLKCLFKLLPNFFLVKRFIFALYRYHMHVNAIMT